MTTTECFTVGQPAFLYVSGYPNVEVDFSPYGFLPAGLPPGSVKVSAWTADMTITDDMIGNVVWFGNSNTAVNDSVDGTWSGMAGTTVTDENVDYWQVADWGSWLTEYLSFGTGAQSDDTVYLSSTGTHVDTGFDFQVRGRTADWDSCSTEGNHWFSSGAAGGINVARTTSGVWIRSGYITTGAANAVVGGAGGYTVPWSAFGFTDGDFEWLRVTGDTTNGIRCWTGGPGSWSVVDTEALPGNFDYWNGLYQVRVGNGLLASSQLGRGFNGDISDLTVADSVDGTPWVDLNLAAAANSSDTSWSSLYSQPDWTKGSNVTHTGAVGGTATIRFDFTVPTRLDEFVAIFVPFNDGFTVDQWCIEYTVRRGGPHVGFLVG